MAAEAAEAADFERQLEEQLTEQRAALDGVRHLLAEEPGSEELAALCRELEAGIAEAEQALLGLARQRLLGEADALLDRHDCDGGGDGCQAAAGSDGDGDGGGQPLLPPGSVRVFRHTDGRHYYGAVVGSCGGSCRLAFLHPTRPYQLEEPVLLPPGALHPAPAGHLPGLLGASAPAWVQAGQRVLVRAPGSRLWEPAELAEVGGSDSGSRGGGKPTEGLLVVAVAAAGRRRLVLPLSAVAAGPHAPDPHADDGGSSSPVGGSGGSGGGVSSWWRGAPSASLRGCVEGGGGDSSSSGGDDDTDGSDGSGSDGGGGEEEEADSSGDSDDKGGGVEGEADAEEGEEEIGWGRFSGGALAQAASPQQRQAEAGPQTDTRLFFECEAHTRGIGSKLLAGMGFRGVGHGLGAKQQGMAQALQATRLRRGAGLGVECAGGAAKIGTDGKKRKCSGKQRRRQKAAEEGRRGRQVQRQAQLELERRTGSSGMFAVLNGLIGDGSQAQAVKRANLGEPRGSGSSSHPGGGSGAAGSSGAAKPAAKKEDRRDLSKQMDDLALLRQKVQRLREMAGRNANDKLMLPQVKRALAEAKAQLRAAERQHDASHKAIHDKERLKRMTKF